MTAKHMANLIRITAVMLGLIVACPVVDGQAYYRTGDPSEDGLIDIGDPVFILNAVFGAPPPCLTAADVNSDLEVDISDAVYLLAYLFEFGPEPACPFNHVSRVNSPPPCPGPSPCHPNTVSHQGFVDTFEGWGPEVTHELVGIVTVEAGSTLTILPGTTILGDFGSALVVLPGGQLDAIGTAQQPIVFSSKDPCPKSGDWLGVYLLGNAPVNVDTAPILPELGFGYGGGDEAHFSGELSHVRIEFAGEPAFGIVPGALNLFGVGSETVIENILIKDCEGDGVRIGGGTVPLKYVVAERCEGDAFDVSLGYQGAGQFWAGRMNSGTGVHGLNITNNPTDFDAEPRTHLTLSNFSLVGSDASTTGILMSAGAAGTFVNGMIQGFPESGMDVDNFATTAHGDLLLDGCSFFGNGEPFETGDDESQYFFTSGELFSFPGGATGPDTTSNFDSLEPIMLDPLGVTGFDACAATAPMLAESVPATVIDVSMLHDELLFSDFRGPVDPAITDWTQAVWISFD